MRRPIALAGITIGVAVLAVGAAGADYYRPSKEAVIAAALKASHLNQWPVFPRRPQGHRCWAFGGGPAPGRSLPRTCWTSVKFRADGSAIVMFIRSIPYWGKRDMGETWVFRVSRSLHVHLVREPRALPETES
jgi:hypothetical protein